MPRNPIITQQEDPDFKAILGYTKTLCLKERRRRKNKGKRIGKGRDRRGIRKKCKKPDAGSIYMKHMRDNYTEEVQYNQKLKSDDENGIITCQ